EVVAWPAKGTSLVLVFDAFSTTVANLFKGSSFSSVGKQLAKLCEANSLKNSRFKEVTRRVRIIQDQLQLWNLLKHHVLIEVQMKEAKNRSWQNKMHFLLTTLKVVYALSTLMPEFMKDERLDWTRRRCKWENDDYIYRGHILNGMSDALFEIYQNVGLAKELWDQLESKYMTKDASSKKFLVSNFNNYKMVDSRPVMEQRHELL
nr:zinc finger, CCHC-type [Tanacetum cinerariifolium]